MPFCVYLAKKNSSTIDVLYYGWTPVLLAMTISSIGGLILDKAVNKFHGIAVFQPVFNGVGGNLVAVQASRISTYLHSEVSIQPQCENFKIFQSLRFYVKSFLENLEVLRLPFFVILGPLNFVDLVNLSLQKVQKLIKIKVQSL